MRYSPLLKLLIATVVTGFAALTLYLFQLNSSNPAPPIAKETIVVSSDYSQKLAPNVRLRMSQIAATENPQVEVLVRVTGVLETEQRSQLETAGLQIRGLLGEVVVGVINLRQIPHLAELDFVRYIELSSPVYPHSAP